jgi:hypothetical protein
VKKNSFGLLELKMVDLEHFWRKTLLGPLEVKEGCLTCFMEGKEGAKMYVIFF